MVHLDILCKCKQCVAENNRQKLYIADSIAKNLERTKKAVTFKDWDYMAIISGVPGVGKSTFAQGLAKFLDPNFESWQICFTAKEFIDKSEKGKRGQAFILDESFADMNSSLYKDPEFISLLNHIQAVRQKNLYLLIVLPDFFTLIKNVAVFRASHLFVPYSEDYSRGDVAVWDRESKRQLYFRGKKECNYLAYEPNIRTDFSMHWFCDKEEYDKRKAAHLTEQRIIKDKGTKVSHQRNVLAYLLHKMTNLTERDMCGLIDASVGAMSEWINDGKERLNPSKCSVFSSNINNNMDNEENKKEDTDEEDNEEEIN